MMHLASDDVGIQDYRLIQKILQFTIIFCFLCEQNTHSKQYKMMQTMPRKFFYGFRRDKETNS